MNRQLSSESAIKLQKILSKRFGRALSQEELEQAYSSLMEFAFALIDMSTLPIQESLQETISIKEPIANFPFAYV